MVISPAQLRWFRLRRSGLVEPFRSPSVAAGALAGVQAQIHTAAGLALWNRVRTLSLDRYESLLGRRRTVVKLWGQRNTLHLYRTRDWPLFASAFRSKPTWLERSLAKRGADTEPYHRMLAAIERRLARGGTITRREMQAMKIAPDNEWLTWGGVVMRLVRNGSVCHATGVGNETRFVHRTHWVPQLPWNPPEPQAAKREIVRRYVRAYGPVTVQDLGFWLGLTVPESRRWMETARDDLVDVTVDGSERLTLRRDRAELSRDAPPARRWPTALLFRFDPLLLGLKQKDWIVPPEHYKKVWRPAGHVEGVVMAGGRVRGTWRYERTPRGLAVTLRPFARLSRSTVRALTGRAEGVAAFFGVALVGVAIEPYAEAD